MFNEDNLSYNTGHIQGAEIIEIPNKKRGKKRVFGKKNTSSLVKNFQYDKKKKNLKNIEGVSLNKL